MVTFKVKRLNRWLRLANMYLVECAWCGELIKKVYTVKQVGFKVSHSICTACMVKFRKSVAKLKT